VDYKHFDQNTMIDGSPSTAPVTYFPFSAAYSGSWIDKGSETDLNSSVNLSIRQWDSGEYVFQNNRFGSDGSFIYYRGDVSHTHDIIGGAQVFVKVQGQASDKPLVNSEQFTIGGLGTVRGYLESEALGDNGISGSFELRTPSLGDVIGTKSIDDWRIYVFSEAGLVNIDNVLPDQQQQFQLASVGAGTRFKFENHYNGSFDFGVPLKNGPNTNAFEPLLTFRLWADF
jgi:hemolysin activation/secretion protein